MVADINTGSNLYGALAYNQEKVDRGQGRVLDANLLAVPADVQFHVGACMQQFEALMPSHIRTAKPIVHISLNPHPDDRISDEQLAVIGREYMERMGFGDQPYIIFKHEDIDRQHLHIVTTRVRGDGSLISDSNNFKRSKKITDALEREYGLLPKRKQQAETWQLSPVDASRGDLKRQLANVIKPLAGMYSFQSLGEYRALLSLYNVRVEEIKGEQYGHRYRGLVYSAVDAGRRVGNPFKSSLFGKTVGIEALEGCMDRSTEQLKPDVIGRTHQRVAACLAPGLTEAGLREALREKGIDLVLRRNDDGRLFGVTYIDHKERTVLNGSRLGKVFSANTINAILTGETTGADLQALMRRNQLEWEPGHGTKTPQPAGGHSAGHEGRGIFSVIPANPGNSPDEKQPPKPHRKKKRRRYGRQG